MKRFILSIIISVVCVAGACAQGDFLKNIGIELADGICLPIDGYHNGKVKIGMSIHANFRYKFENTPYDCGIFFQLDDARWNLEHNGNCQANKTLAMGVLGSYNFRQGENINPYVSMGVGVAYHKSDGDILIPVKDWSGVIVPKIGIDFFHWLRLSAFCQVSCKGYNTAGLSLGLTFDS